ncbi:hypothetical protein [Alkalihalobacterium alkalinitrilicum]|uniref:hypothetical protein n=1 Tax=Alkalihalobacterium alkalinitrilicum TaxID=427920 RepID=UPI000994F451|nr:hypothetical protein [Alkalihalobacterium alkalinitrilicum]
MLFNFVLGLLFPWILLLYVLRKHTKYIILFAPIGASLAFFFNELGFQYFWGMKPIYKNITFSALPLNLGIYPVLSSFIGYFFTKRKVHPFVWILGFSLTLTIFEWLFEVYGIVFYINGWNIFWTYVSYVLAFALIYGYYRLLVKYSIIRVDDYK